MGGRLREGYGVERGCGVGVGVGVGVEVVGCGVGVVSVRKDGVLVDEAGGHQGVVGGVYHGAVGGVYHRKVEVLWAGSFGAAVVGFGVGVAAGMLVVASGVHHGVVGGVYHRKEDELDVEVKVGAGPTLAAEDVTAALETVLVVTAARVVLVGPAAPG